MALRLCVRVRAEAAPRSELAVVVQYGFECTVMLRRSLPSSRTRVEAVAATEFWVVSAWSGTLGPQSSVGSS